MSKLKNLKTMLQNMLMQFSQLSTDRGLLSWSGEGDEYPAVGDIVVIIDEEGNESKPENGEYKDDSGNIYVIVEGKVEEIKKYETPEEETTPEDEPQAEDQPNENEPETVEEPATEEPVETEPEDQPQAEEEPTEEGIDERDERIRNLESEVARLEEENGALRERIAELEKKSAAEPAEEAFERINKIEKTGNKKIDRLIDILNA